MTDFCSSFAFLFRRFDKLTCKLAHLRNKNANDEQKSVIKKFCHKDAKVANANIPRQLIMYGQYVYAYGSATKVVVDTHHPIYSLARLISPSTVAPKKVKLGMQ